MPKFRNTLKKLLDPNITLDNSKNIYARTCPFCGDQIDLLRCPVVKSISTASNSAALRSNTSFDDEAEDAGGAVDSDSKDKDVEIAPGIRLPKEDILWDPSVERKQPSSGPTGLFTTEAANPLPDLFDNNEWYKSGARRACYSCGEKLPVEIDTRSCQLMGIAGVNRAGKTHFVAQAFREITASNGLERFGCTRVKLSESTGRELYQKYYPAILDSRQVLGPTDPNQTPQPLLFSIDLTDCEPMLVMTRDISGEAIMDENKRRSILEFLTRSDGLIFVIDPIEFNFVRERVPQELLLGRRSVNQVDLLQQCLMEVHRRTNKSVPVVVTISKCDLLINYCGLSGLWSKPPLDSWQNDTFEIDREIREMLISIGEESIVKATQGYAKTYFQAFSALGGDPIITGPTASVARLPNSDPIRCADTLGTVLRGMATKTQTVR